MTLTIEVRILELLGIYGAVWERRTSNYSMENHNDSPALLAAYDFQQLWIWMLIFVIKNTEIRYNLWKY